MEKHSTLHDVYEMLVYMFHNPTKKEVKEFVVMEANTRNEHFGVLKYEEDPKFTHPTKTFAYVHPNFY